MCLVALLLTCCISAGHARRVPLTRLGEAQEVHHGRSLDTRYSSHALANLLLKLTSTAAFNPSGPGVAKASRATSRPVPCPSMVSAPPGFTPPEPKPLTVTGDIGGVLTGSAALAMRFGAGCFVMGWSPFRNNGDENAADDAGYALSIGPVTIRDDSLVIRGECDRPSEPLVLYEYEASPFCRKVREAMAMLDLTVVLKPCPGARAGFSDELNERTGRRTVPYLVDPNNGKEMFESDEIVNYLFNTYGPGEDQVPLVLKDPIAMVMCSYAAVARGMAGSRRQPNARPDNEQMQPIEIWGYEGSPFVRPVREKLCALALPHKMVCAARGSANRDVLFAKTGRFQVPYISDPNTGVEMFESIAIVDYLEKVYTTGA